MYRIKFTLADGRQVYPTDKGRFQLVDADAIGSRTVQNLIARGAYSASLSLFVMDPPGPGYVRIVGAAIEPVDSPVDTQAFVLGGRRAAPQP